MTDQAEVDQWHRNFAVELFNHSWDLLEKTDRAPADDDDRQVIGAQLATVPTVD